MATEAMEPSEHGLAGSQTGPPRHGQDEGEKLPARLADKLDSKAAGADHRTGKYLTFLLGREEFAIQVLKVREIMGILDITAVPQTPSYVKGVINLRGKVIPVVDLRLKF